jgi:hypothetical protein
MRLLWRLYQYSREVVMKKGASQGTSLSKQAAGLCRGPGGLIAW